MIGLSSGKKKCYDFMAVYDRHNQLAEGPEETAPADIKPGRFDEWGVETEPLVTAPRLDSTDYTVLGRRRAALKGLSSRLIGQLEIIFIDVEFFHAVAQQLPRSAQELGR